MTSPHFPTLPSGAEFATYPLPQAEQWNPIAIGMENGATEVRSIWSKPVRRWSLRGYPLPLKDVDIVMGFLRDRKGGGNYWYYDIPVIPIWSPYDAPTTSTTVSGSIGARTYDIAYVHSDGTSISNISQKSTQAVAANSLATFTAPEFPSGVTEVRIYLGTTTGTLYFAGTEGTSKGTWTEPFSTVDADSNSGQKVLQIAATTDFEAGQQVIIAESTAREENKVIDTVQAGASITFTEVLGQTHTAVQADEVYLESDSGGGGTAQPTTNSLTGEEVKVRLVGDPQPRLIGTGAYDLTLIIEEMF